MKNIVFVCGAKDFHAIDKYRITSKIVYPRRMLLLTDTIESEGQPKLISDESSLSHLYIIDRLLFRKQSALGHIWRNMVKLLFIPIQVYRLKRFYAKNPDCIYHALPMYYIMLCYWAKVPFVATPQGSEILVRAVKSKIYRYYAIRSLKAARKVVVDSVSMKNTIFELSKVHSVVLKNGFDTTEVLKTHKSGKTIILSIRGMHPMYRIDKIIQARLHSKEKPAISFVYPAMDEDFKSKVREGFSHADIDLGRLEKAALYETMANTLLAISIPTSDSSPRSVYECIFAGACVAVTYSPYLDELPMCMRERIYLVDINDEGWLDKAILYARKITAIPFVPSEEAFDMCDQERTIRKVINELYK